MRTKSRYLATLLAATGACATIAVAPVADCRARMHEHRAEHDTV